MFLALDENNEKVYIEEVLDKKNKKYTCPSCGGELIIKNGSVNAAHFAHKSSCDCDSFTHDMSKWHRDWQNVFPKKNREVVLKLDVTKKDYDCYGHNYYFSDMNDSKDYFDLLCYYEKHPEEANEMLHLEHRADVLACGYVIEFQHSPINKKEFNERNWFYTTCGYRVIWIFDLREKYNNNQIEYIDDVSRGYTYKYKWNNAYKTFSDFLPQNFKGGYNDEGKWEKGDVLLFFQLYDEVEGEDDDEQSLMEQVVWAIEDDETGDANFKTFITNYDRPCNKKNFFDAIKRRKL